MSRFQVGYFVGSISSGSINRQLAQALIPLAPERLAFCEIPGARAGTTWAGAPASEPAAAER